MKKTKKISLAVLFGAVSFTVLYFGALFSIPKLVDLNKYKEEITTQIEQQSGFKVNCENVVFKQNLSPELKVYLYHTLVLYPNDEVFLKLRETELKVKILPLLFKKVVVKNATFTRPIINMTLYKDFSTSFEKFIDKKKMINTKGFSYNPIILDSLCKNYKFKIKDESLNKTFYLEGEELYLEDIKFNDNGRFVLKGSLYENNKEYLKYDFDIVAPFNKRVKSFTFSPFKTIYESDIKGFVQGRFTIGNDYNVSGNVNIKDLSLKADNVRLNNNDINVLFNGKEANINAKLHTSLKDYALVNGKFNYGKNKYIDVQTKAKNVDLTNLLKIINVLSDSLNIPNEIEDVKLAGLVDADFSLNSDFKKLKSSGSFKVINANLSHKKLPYALKNINADINLDNNKVIIKEAKSIVNTTPIIITGEINQDLTSLIKIKSSNLDLIKLVKVFNLDKQIPAKLLNGKLSFDSEISGKLNKNYVVDTKAIISNLSFVENRYKLPISISNLNLDIKLDGKKYNGDILCSNLSTKIEKTPFKFEKLNLKFDNNKIQIPENTLYFNSSPIKVKGLINDYNKNLKANFDFNGEIYSENIASFLKTYINQPYKAKGNIPMMGSVSLADDLMHLKVQLKANKDNYLSYVVLKELLNKNSLLDISVDINGFNYDVKDISLYENIEPLNKIISLNGKVANNKYLMMDNLKVEIPNSVTIATNFFGGEEASLCGNFTLNNTIKNPKILGEAKVFYYNLKKYLTSIKNADISISDNNVRIIAPDVQINDSKFNIVADILPIFNDKLVVNNVQLNSVNLDFNSLYKLIEKERNPFAKSLIEVKKGIATINNLKILDLKAKDISADFSIIDNVLTAENINARAYSGQIGGKLTYDLPHNHLGIALNGQNIDLKNSLFDLCKLNDNIEGIADFDSSLFLTVSDDYETTIKSLNGKLNFHSINGRMGTLGKFEYYLSAQNILYHGFLNTTLNRIVDALHKDNTAHYRFADGSVIFQNGYMITESIKTIGQDMSLFITGRHNLLTNQVNVDMYGRISDDIKGKLGSFGNVSISDFMENKSLRQNKNLILLKKSLINRIPNLYNQENMNTNTFKVNLYGDITSLNVINSFMWVLSQEEVKQAEETLPDFSDINSEL